jgi:hypothetical protein
MKTIASFPLRLWWIAASCCALVPTAYAGGILNFLLPRHELEAITVTDVTPAGHQRRQASPAAPMYYVAVNAGYRDFGAAIAGEHMISPRFANETMLTTLAKRGYLPAAPNQRPDLVLVWTWGTLNAERSFQSFNGYSPHVNDRRILRFLGGDKLGLTSKYADPFPELSLPPGLLYRGGDARNYIDASSDNYFVAVIAAYDPEHLSDLKHAQLLWSTRISCPSLGFWLPAAFPGMLAIAGPYIGRETTKPVWVRATEQFKPEVRLGDLQVAEYIESNKSAVIDLSPNAY